MDKFLIHHCLHAVMHVAEFWKAHNIKWRAEQEIEYTKVLNDMLPDTLKYRHSLDYDSIPLETQWPKR